MLKDTINGGMLGKEFSKSSSPDASRLAWLLTYFNGEFPFWYPAVLCLLINEAQPILVYKSGPYYVWIQSQPRPIAAGANPIMWTCGVNHVKTLGKGGWMTWLIRGSYGSLLLFFLCFDLKYMWKQKYNRYSICETYHY